MTRRVDAVNLLTSEHEAVEQLFAKYEGATDDAERTRIAHEVVHELAVHGEIEELLLYPRLRRALPDGDELADHAIQEHVDIKESLNQIDSMTAGEEGFDELVRSLVAEVRHHVEEEESELFPRLREALSKEDLLALGANLETAKSMVPTRPHPTAPTGPVAKLVTSPPVALIDRVRDALRSAADQARQG